MTLTVGSTYLLRFKIDEKHLVFTGKIIDEDDILIRFEDKFGAILSYNKTMLISAEEIKKAEETEDVKDE